MYIKFFVHNFFNCYLAVPRPFLGHYREGNLTHSMLITSVLHIRPEGDRESRSKVASLRPTKRLAGFEPSTFQFWSQRLNSLGQSPPKDCGICNLSILCLKLLSRKYVTYVLGCSFIKPCLLTEQVD